MRAILLTAVCLSTISIAYAQTNAIKENRPPVPRPATPVQSAAPVQPAAVAPLPTFPPSMPPPVPPPAPSAEPQSTTATFGDWVLRCQRLGDEAKPQKSCEVAQSIQVQGQTTPFAQVAVGRRGPDEPLRATVLVPNNITLPGNIAIAADDKDDKPLQLTWRRCVPGGCLADAEVPADILGRWRAVADAGRVSFQDSTGRTLVFPLSFRGLSQALDGLGKS